MTNPEILSLNDSNKNAAAPEPDALINRIQEGTGTKLTREVEMVSKGVYGAAVDLVSHPLDKAGDIVGSLAVGGTLGTLSEAGRLGGYTAAAVGLAMAGKMVYDEVTGKRWSTFGNAVSDTWKSGDNLSANIDATKNSLGAFAVDTTIGIAGFKAGAGMYKMALGGSLIAASELGAASEMKLAPARVGAEAGPLDRLGRSFHADLKLGDGDVLTRASEVLKKPTQKVGLDQIGQAVLESKMGKDRTVVEIKTQIDDLTRQHRELSTSANVVAREIGEHGKQLQTFKTIAGEDLTKPASQTQMSPEMKGVKAAQENVESIKQIQEKLPGKETELKELERQVSQHQKPAAGADAAKRGGKPSETADADFEALKQTRNELKEEVRTMRQDGSEQALTSARVRVAEAQERWQAAHDAAPAKIAELEGTPDKPGIIGMKQAQLEQMTASGTQLTSGMSNLLDRLDARRTEIKSDIGLIDEVKEPPKPSRAERRGQSGDTASGDNTAAADRRPAGPRRDVGEEKPPAREVREPKVQLSPEAQAKANADAAFGRADAEVARFNVAKELKMAKAKEGRITSGEQTFPDEATKTQALEQARVELAKAQRDMQSTGAPRYAQTVRALRDFAASAEDYMAKDPTEAGRIAFSRAAVEKLEGLMKNVDNIYKGVNGQVPDLKRINLERPFDPYKRLGELREHLENRIKVIDRSQEGRVTAVAANPIFADLLKNAGELPEDGAIFFLRNGKMVVDSSNRSIMIDVARLGRGIDKDGAGLYRFIGQEADIDGAAIIKPKLDGAGNPIKLRGSTPDNPRFVKEVVGFVGEPPEGARIGMSFGEAMKRFGPER